MQGAQADMSEADEAAWTAMLEGWREELARVGGEWGRMPAASAMLFVALRSLQVEVGNDPLAAMLDAVSAKVRAGEPITMKAGM